MNTLPALFEERMRKLLPEESEAFFAALQTEPPVSIRLNPGKPVPISRLFPDEQIGLPVSWCESAYYLKSRPVFTLDPCLHSGTYYVQEASSIERNGIEQPYKATFLGGFAPPATWASRDIEPKLIL